MESFLFALNAVLPIVLTVAVGYGLKRIGWLNVTLSKALNKLVFRVFLPLMLFLNVYRIESLSLSYAGYLGYMIGVLAVVFALWGEWTLRIYTQTPEVIAVGMEEFSIMVTFYFLCGFMNVTGSAVRGLGRSLTSMIVSMVGVVGFRLVWLATVFQIPQYHTYTGLMMSYPISWTATFLIQLGCWYYAIRKLKRQNA